MSEMEIKYLNPLTDKQKELLFGCKIENLTPKELFEKYGHLLSDEEKKLLSGELKTSIPNSSKKE